MKHLAAFKNKKVENKTPSIVHRIQAMEIAMNTKWGYRQLHNLVNEDLRYRFKDQEKLFWNSYFKGASKVDEEGESLLRGYKALDEYAESIKAPKVQKNMVEGLLDNGEVFCVIADGVAEDRYPKEITITVQEVGKILSKLSKPVLDLKRELYGSRIVEIRDIEEEGDYNDLPF